VTTRWIPAHRADLGLRSGDLAARPLPVTNRAWYLLHQFLTGADRGDWLQVGRWNGHAVVAAGITHRDTAGYYTDTHELTALADTPLHVWLAEVGMHLSTTPSGLVITAAPHKENRMSINLSKGGKVDLTKAAGGTLNSARIALGWDVRRTDGQPYDLDSSVIGLGADGFSVGGDWFVFYNNPKAPGDVVVHQGDNLTGAGHGDDEQIVVNLAQIPAHVTELVVAVTIHEAKQRGGQNFGLVENAYVRVIDESNGTELARYDLTEDTDPGVNSLVFGKLYRRGDAWNFRAIGDGFTEELAGLVAAYRIS
jgi:tellurium resistance protein TerD